VGPVIPLELGPPRGDRLQILALGAHPDDIEIGAAGTILRLLDERPGSELRMAVFSASPERAVEAHASAAAIAPAERVTLTIHDLPDRLFPSVVVELKAALELLAQGPAPDVILAPRLEDRHQDHRALAEATWQSFRDHLVLEYEIPKYEGDLGTPNVFVPLSAGLVQRKVDLLTSSFPSQASRTWFDAEAFRAILRLRGIESNAPSGYAEAFTARKLRL
jgi:LmbE family N-acetylglucosaminyl deacetylase